MYHFYIENAKFDYETDGIVFTPVDDAIKVGTHDTMFKWKPRDQNTVDFLVKKRPAGWGLYIQEKGKLFFECEIPFGFLETELEENTIVECQYMINDEQPWWKPIGVRKDKTYPNSRFTFFRTVVNVKEDIKIILGN